MQDSLVPRNPFVPTAGYCRHGCILLVFHGAFRRDSPNDTSPPTAQETRISHSLPPPQQSEVALENDSREAGFAVSSLLLAGIFDARDSTVTDDLDLQHFLKCCIN